MTKTGSLKKYLKPLAWALTLLVVIFSISLAWLFTGRLSAAKIGIFRKIPLPLALVGGQTVSAKDFLARYDIAAAYSAKQGMLEESKLKQDIYSNLLKDKIAEMVANHYGVQVSQKQIDWEFQAEQGLQAQNSQNGGQFLSGYGISEADYKRYITKPQLTFANLQAWFNSQRPLNEASYRLADAMLADIRSGQDMGLLAENFSEDPQSKIMQGDLGFMQMDEIIPEMRQGIDALGAGEAEIISSRNGIHVIKLEGKDNNGQQGSVRYHLRQIFIKPANFQDWYGKETQNYKVTLLINSLIKSK
ncbi:MAG: peptidylprolyl isomerase [Patescibacteria group bacterium]|nr:peptidylprolyl isomerase [Patescibacteria group bacterium]